MKKLWLLLLVLVMTLSLTGCFGGEKKVSKTTFSVSDQVSSATLEVTPDYAKRTIALIYMSKSLTGDKQHDNAGATGQVGGDYFDKFEKIVKFVMEYDKEDTASAYGGVFKVVVDTTNGKSYEIVLNDTEKNKESEDLRAFYLDVTTLLTESEQV